MGRNQGTKLLVVDDDEDDLYLICEALREVEGACYSVTTATSSLAAMGILSHNSFDVIFSDYRLVHLTGIDFINHVRAAGIETPIILLTGITDHIIDNAALQAGASDFIPKAAINPDVLDRAVRYAMAHSERQRLLQAVLKSTVSGVAVLDQHGSISLTNPRFHEFAKSIEGGETIKDTHPRHREFNKSVYGEDLVRLEKLVAHALDSVEKDIHVGDLIVEAHVTVLPEGGSVLILHDVTARVDELKERELAEKKIRMIAMQDTLTGLPNRLAFNDHLDSCLEKAAISNTGVAILSFDFNRFKEVNDLMGHAAGDHLLKTAATRLTDLLSEREYAARLGGDEFIVIQEGSSVAEALELATRVVENMAKPLEWAARIIEPNISVGIALFPDQGRNRQDLLSNADIAMYRSKANDDGPVCIFDPSMDQMARDRRNVARDLKLAIPNNELLLHYQPQFKAGTGELAGFEALLRWKSAGRIIVPPSDFIPIAEESGMICEIDEWVLRESCRAMVNWNLVPRIAVNISAKAICQPGLIASIKSTLLETGLAPSRLELEVTETALVQDLNRALHNLRQIKALGISIAMDDFGIGYSSLSLLNSFPFDRIKIDKSFIQLAGSNPRADAIFHTIIGLGSALGVPVLVEGVENSEHLDFATISGCEEVQGFHFGQPVSAPEMNGIFKNLAGPLKYYVIKRQQEATVRGALRA